MFFPIVGDPYRSSVVLHLPMTGENNSTSFVDISPSSKTMTPTNAIISTSQSKFGGSSGYFANKTAYLSTPNVESLKLHSGDYTVEMWVYFLTVPNGVALIANQYTVSNDRFPFTLAFASGFLGNNIGSILYFGYYNGNWNGVFSDFTPSINTWYHIAATRLGNVIKVFVDGVQRATMTISSQPIAPTQQLLIGRRWDNNGEMGINGYLQEVRITKNIARYTENFTPFATPFPAREPELSVTSIFDSSSLIMARKGL